MLMSGFCFSLSLGICLRFGPGFIFRFRLSFCFRFRLGLGFNFLNLPLRLLPFLNCSNVLAPQFLVEFMDSLDDLRRHTRRCLGFCLRFRLCVCFRLGFSVCLRLRLRFGFKFSLSFGFRLRFSVCFRLRLSLGFRFRLGRCLARLTDASQLGALQQQRIDRHQEGAAGH